MFNCAQGVQVQCPIEETDFKTTRKNADIEDGIPRYLFEPDYYRSQLSTAESQASRNKDRISLWRHYIDIGSRRGLSPSPYFDYTWYAMTNSDLEEYSGNIVAHYLSVGRKKHRDPHPSFRSHAYWKTYLAETDPDTDPLEHYATVGSSLGYNPNQLFWNSWYRKKYLPNGLDNVDPFIHFILVGQYESCHPNPLFDCKYYRDQLNSGKFADPDPLSHYCHVGWKNGLAPHPLFDPDYFLKSINTKLSDAKSPPLELFLENPVGDPHPLFDTEYYKSNLAAKNLSLSHNIPIVDFLEDKSKHHQNCHPLFSAKYYISQSADLQNADIIPLVHYARSGWRENRAVHPLFDLPFYSETISLSERENPIVHYCEIGSKSGLPCRRDVAPDRTIRPLPSSRIVHDLPTNYEIESDGDEFESSCGAFMHIFYPELAKEMISAANNIPAPCTVFISTDDWAKAKQIEQVCESISKHPFEIRLCPNRGRDIAPFIVGFSDRIREVDYGVHIHSKRSKHYAKEFESWRKYLFEGNLGSPSLVRNIISLLKRDNVGAVMPEHYYPIRSLLQWGGNFANTKKLMATIGEEIYPESILDFPSGSMFWFKTEAIKPLLDIGLSYLHFDHEKGQVDGTLAHAVERAFLFVVQASGYEYAVINPVSGDDTSPETEDVLSKLKESNSFMVRKNDLGVMSQHYPELSKFSIRKSSIEKPRLNLLIPTVDRSVGYAGVSSALDFFSAVRNHLGSDFDARMLSTDVSPGNQFVPPSGYEVTNLWDLDRENTNVVTDAAIRFRSPAFCRERDVFVATAWWTATLGFEICEAIASKFGSEQLPLVYLIQDNETGFYPFSTKYALCQATYSKPDHTIPAFNTELLQKDFSARGLIASGHILEPGINGGFKAAIQKGIPKEKICLLYARPHAVRNCLDFLEMVIDELVRVDPVNWTDWKFYAIGEDFEASQLKTKQIDVLGRLSLSEYAELSSRAALGISLMVSPHPSYPPLEMAEAGVKVLTNKFGGKDLSELHENISSFDSFDIVQVLAALNRMLAEYQQNRNSGWEAKPKVEWFFGGKSNMPDVTKQVAEEIRNHVS